MTESNLLGALARMQQVVTARFSKGMDEVVVCYSCKVEKWKLDEINCDVICQSPTLSLPGPGKSFLVIDRERIVASGKQVEVIDREYLDYLLDLSASTYAIEDTKVGAKATATKAVKQAIQRSRGFAEGRAAILSRM